MSGFEEARRAWAPGTPESFEMGVDFTKVYAAKYRVALAMPAPHAQVVRFGSRRDAETSIQILSR
jgi:hypothetical protein